MSMSTNVWPIDLLYGSDELRRGLDAGHSADRIVASWEDEIREFLPIRARYLIY